MKTRIYLAAFTALFLCLSGCESLGLVKATSFEQNVAYAWGNVTSAREAGTDALRSGTIRVEVAKVVQAKADLAVTALDLATHLHAIGNTADAKAKLVEALTLISEMQGALNMQARPK